MANFDSTYRGLVVRNNDPQAEARVVLRIPQILGSAESAWARPSAFTSSVPKVGDTVYVTFEGGDLSNPVYTPQTTIDASTAPIPKTPTGLQLDYALTVTSEGVSFADLTATWVAPTENQDGSTPVHLVGYFVYFSQDGTTWESADVVDQPSWVRRGLLPGRTYYVRVASINEALQPSPAPLPVAQKVVPTATPPADSVLGQQGNRIDNSVQSITTEYAVNSSETVAPTTGWATATPTRTPGTFVWYRVTVTRNDSSTTTTNPALLTGNTGAAGATGATGPAGSPAPLINLTSTAQVLAVPAAGGATTPATATVTGTAANTAIVNWTYSVDGGSFSATVPAGVSRTGNVVTVTGSTMTARTITIKADDGAVGDTLTVARVADGATGATGPTGNTGAAGADAYTVLLTNEAQVFAGSTNAALTGSATATVLAYKGTSQKFATVGTITGQVTGLTSSVANNTGSANPVITVSVTSSLTQQSGTLTIPVTVDGVSFTKLFAWSVSYTGAAGATGPTGSTGPAGTDGVSITSVTPYFQTVTAGAAAPAKPTANPPGGTWTGTEPAYVANTDLYRTEQVAFSNASWAYTAVSKVSSYAAAITAANGKTKVTYSTSLPGTTANNDGDVWFRYVTGGTIIGQWTGRGTTTWEQNTLRDEVIASVNAGKLLTGTLQATTTVTVGTAGSARVEIAGGGTSPGIAAYNSSNVRTFWLDSATGNASFMGSILSGSTIIGAAIQTGSSGQRWVLGTGSGANTLYGYSGRTDETSPYGLVSDVDGVRLVGAGVTGVAAGSTPAYIQVGNRAMTGYPKLPNGVIYEQASSITVGANGGLASDGVNYGGLWSLNSYEASGYSNRSALMVLGQGATYDARVDILSGGDVRIGGNDTSTASLVVNATGVTTSKRVTATSGIAVSGTASTIAGGLTVSGNLTANNAVTVTGTLTANNAVTVNSTLDVSSNVSVGKVGTTTSRIVAVQRRNSTNTAEVEGRFYMQDGDASGIVLATRRDSVEQARITLTGTNLIVPGLVDANDTGWVTCTLNSGYAWQNGASGEPIQVRKKLGIIYIRGAVSNTGITLSATNTVASMPSWAWPTKNVVNQCGTSAGAASAVAFVTNGGDLQVRTNNVLSSYYFFGGFTWPTD